MFGPIDLTDPVNWDHPLNAGLGGWWLALENSWGGTELRDVAGGRHGTLTNGPTWAAGPHEFQAPSLSFAGTSNQYALSSQASGPARVTLSAWCRFPSIGSAGENWIVGYTDGNGSGTFDKVLRITNVGNPEWYVFDGGIKTCTASSALTAGRWHWLCGTADGTNIRLYVDGIEAASTSAGDTYTGYGTPKVLIGGNSIADWLTFGADDVRAYPFAMSADQAYGLYEQSAKGHPNTLRRVKRRGKRQAASFSNISGTCSLPFTAGSSTLTATGTLTASAPMVFGAGSSTLTASGALLGTSTLIFDDGSSFLQGYAPIIGDSNLTFGEGSSTVIATGILIGSSALTFSEGSSSLSGIGNILGLTDMVFGVGSSTITAIGTLVGSLDLIFDYGSTTLIGEGTLLGSSTLTFDLAGALSGLGSGAITGTSVITTTLTGAITASGTLLGTSDITIIPTGTFIGIGSILGTSELIFTSSASIIGIGGMLGSSSIIFGGTNVLSGTGSLLGASSILLTLTGITQATGTLSGSSLITFISSTTATGTASILGSSSIIFTLVLDSQAPVQDLGQIVIDTINFQHTHSDLSGFIQTHLDDVDLWR